MIRWISVAFGVMFIVLSASILGCLATMVDAVEWQPFFVRGAIGAFALLLVLGVAEALAPRR